MLAGQLLIPKRIHEMEDNSGTLIPMVAKGSWRSKLPSALIISSANLRVQDVIGEGESAPT